MEFIPFPLGGRLGRSKPRTSYMCGPRSLPGSVMAARFARRDDKLGHLASCTHRRAHGLYRVRSPWVCPRRSLRSYQENQAADVVASWTPGVLVRSRLCDLNTTLASWSGFAVAPRTPTESVLRPMVGSKTRPLPRRRTPGIRSDGSVYFATLASVVRTWELPSVAATRAIYPLPLWNELSADQTRFMKERSIMRRLCATLRRCERLFPSFWHSAPAQRGDSMCVPHHHPFTVDNQRLE